MKHKASKRILSLLMTAVMVIGIFAIAVPVAANGSAYVYTFSQLKSNLQNPDITDVYVYTMEDNTPWLPIQNNADHDYAIKMVGEKNLHLVGQATIRVPENPNEDYIRFTSLIHVPAGASLTVDGDGSLTFDARWPGFVNAVIHNQGDLVIRNADLAGVSMDAQAEACAIWHNSGALTIYDGSFYGVNKNPSVAHWGAVRLCAPALIKDGYFRSAIGQEGAYGLMIPNRIIGDITITGGMFRSIYLPAEDSVMATYVPSQYTTLKDGYWFNKDAAYGSDYLAGGTIKVVNWIKEVSVSIKPPMEGQPLDYQPVTNTEGYYLTTPVWIRDGNALDETKGPSAEAGASYKLKAWAIAKDTDSYEFATPGNFNASINDKAATVSETGIFDREDVVVLELDFGVCQKLAGEAYLSIAGPEELEPVRFSASVTNTDLCSVLSNIKWYENGTEIFSGAVFQEGKSYSVLIQIKAKSGCQFPVDERGNPSVYCRVNGYDAEVYAVAGKDPSQYAAVRFDFGQCNDSIIEEIVITGIVPPVPGAHPSYTATVQGSGYRVDTTKNQYYDAYWKNPPEKWYFLKNGVSWWDVTDGDYEYVYENDVFLPGHEYRCEVYVCTEDGYEFVQDLYTDPETWPGVTVNGNPGELTFNSMSGLNRYQEAAYTFPAAPADIESVTVTGLEIPVAGAAPDYAAGVDNPYLYAMDTESGYNDSGIWWYDEDGRYVIPGYHTFEAGRTYHVQLRVAAAKLDNGDPAGRFVDPVAATLEGFAVDRVRVWDEVIVIDAYYTCPGSPEGGTVTGSITVPDDSEPVTIHLIAEGTSEPAYEAFGRESFSFTGIPSGRYSVVVSKKNHVPRTYRIEVADGKINLDIKLHMVGDIDGNGRVNMGDVIKLNAHVKGITPITDDYELLCANVNGGRLNTGDTSMLYAHVKGSVLIY